MFPVQMNCPSKRRCIPVILIATLPNTHVLRQLLTSVPSALVRSWLSLLPGPSLPILPPLPPSCLYLYVHGINTRARWEPMHASVCTVACIIYGDQSLTSGVLLCLLPPWLLRQGLSLWMWSSLFQQDWLAIKASGSVLSARQSGWQTHTTAACFVLF